MSHIRRMTPLRVVDDIDEEGLFYEAFGATRMEASSGECIGYKGSNDTCVILASRQFAVNSYGPFIAQQMARKGARYFYVDNIDAQLAELPGSSHLVTRTVVSGVEEAVIDTGDGFVVLACEMEEVRVE